MTKLKTVLTLLLAAVMLLSLCACGGDTVAEEPSPSPSPTPDPGLYTVRSDEVPYYTAPLTGFEYTLGTLNEGDQVRYVDKSGQFIQASLPDGTVAWVYSWYLVAANPETEQTKISDFVSVCKESSGFTPVESDLPYTCTAETLNCRSAASTKGVILTQIEFGDEVTIIGRDGDFYLCYLASGDPVYCAAKYLKEAASYVELEGANDLSVYMPGAEFDLRFTTVNNVTGQALYPAVPLLEASTAEMLMEAYEVFREAGYTLKVYDAYRPQSAQDKLTEAGIADDGHQSGRAVDITLVNSYTGEELEMPTSIYAASENVARDKKENWTSNARVNIAYITQVMTSVGFEVDETNWWHYENPGEGGIDAELDWDSLTYVPVSYYGSSTDPAVPAA